jgi:L-threonylcarbamoyladenylate synthase
MEHETGSKKQGAGSGSSDSCFSLLASSGEPPATSHQPSATQVRPLADPAAQRLALALLAEGEIIIAPTDTVYGVMCRYDSPAAIARLYAAKERPPEKAIPVLIGAIHQLNGLVQSQLPAGAAALMAHFWPGPLTLVLPAQPHLPSVLTAGLSSVAVRMPAHPALCALLTQTGPLAATSANRSGRPESHTADEALAQLAGRVPLILADEDEDTELEAGAQVTLPSTIVDLTGPAGPRLLRPGPIAQAVRACLAEVGLALEVASS